MITSETLLEHNFEETTQRQSAAFLLSSELANWSEDFYIRHGELLTDGPSLIVQSKKMLEGDAFPITYSLSFDASGAQYSYYGWELRSSDTKSQSINQVRLNCFGLVVDCYSIDQQGRLVEVREMTPETDPEAVATVIAKIKELTKSNEIDETVTRILAQKNSIIQEAQTLDQTRIIRLPTMSFIEGGKSKIIKERSVEISDHLLADKLSKYKARLSSLGFLAVEFFRPVTK